MGKHKKQSMLYRTINRDCPNPTRKCYLIAFAGFILTALISSSAGYAIALTKVSDKATKANTTANINKEQIIEEKKDSKDADSKLEKKVDTAIIGINLNSSSNGIILTEVRHLADAVRRIENKKKYVLKSVELVKLAEKGRKPINLTRSK